MEILDEYGCCTASSGDHGWNLEVDGWQNNVSDTEGNVINYDNLLYWPINLFGPKKTF